ncbi:MAG: CHRD domain-containing protein [Acidobacteriota bacterium]|nr:CHRD domain-containing protein [Acidobacteriota bacterium]
MLALAAAPAAAQSFTLTAQLSGAGEATQVANGVNTGAFGDATVVLNLTAQTVTWTVRVFNLPSGVTAAHIHVGAPATPGPTVVNFTVVANTSNDFSFTGTAAFSTFTLRPDQGIRSPEDMVQAILGENTYINVHSTVNPGGEIRGQLRLSR